jgi:hypothetical protein
MLCRCWRFRVADIICIMQVGNHVHGLTIYVLNDPYIQCGNFVFISIRFPRYQILNIQFEYVRCLG